MTEHTIVLRRDASAVPAPDSALQGLRILFLPKNSRTPYFTSLLTTAGRDCGWTVSVIGPAGTEKVWRDVIAANGAFVTMPDFDAVHPFEQDDSASASLDDFIAACERTSGISASRILLAGERDIGRGFSRPIFYWFHDRTTRRVLRDNAEPMRIVRRMFAFARETLQAQRPDLVMAGEWANPLCFTFYLAAQELGIPCVVNRLSKLWSGRCYWSASPMMYNDASIASAAVRRAARAPASERAQQRISEFRNRPKTLGYVQQNWDILDRPGGRGSHREFARIFVAGLRNKLGRSGPQAKPALRLMFDIYRRKWLKMRQARFFRRYDESELRGTRYVLIALHKDPEQSLNYQAPVWANQYNTISMLSGSLPDGYKLLVREHRNNIGRRPTRWYKDLAILPGLQFIDGLDDQFKYIRNASLIVTENGSVGWEGLLLNRPVITLADAFYDGAGLTRRVRIHDELSSHVLELALQTIEQSPARDQALAAALDAEWETTAPLEAAHHHEALQLLAKLLPLAQTQNPARQTAVTV